MKKSIFLFFAAVLCAIGMNAETYRYSGEKDGWAGTQMTVSSDGYYSYYGPVTGAHQFKIGTSSNQWAYNHSYVSKGFNSTDITDLGDYGGDNAFCWSSSQHYILVYHPSTKINSSSKVKICASTFLPDDSETDLPEPEPEPTELTYNVTVPAGTNVCYICGNMTSWKFTEMTKVDDTHYTITIEGAKKDDEYKYASGSDWGYVEKDANGSEIGNRTYVDGNDVVAKWAAVYEPDAVEQELTYSVTVPEGTYTCYIAMDTDPESDGWEFTEMTKVDETHYTFVRTGLKNKTYKYAAGPSWDFVEKNAEGGDVADRQWAESDVVAKWNAIYDPTPTYNVTVTVNPADAGTVEGAGEYKEGTQVTLTATAAEGYEFVGWAVNGGDPLPINPFVTTVNADLTVVAHFQEAPQNEVKEFEVEANEISYDVETKTLTLYAYWEEEEVVLQVANVELGVEVDELEATLTVGEDQTEELAGVIIADNTVEVELDATSETTGVNYIVTISATLYEVDALELTNLSATVDGETTYLFAFDNTLSIDLTVAADGSVESSSIYQTMGYLETELILVKASKIVKTYDEELATDVYTGQLVVSAEGYLYGYDLKLYNKPAEPIIVVVENATIDDQTETSGFMFMSGQWTDAENVVYPVTVEVPGFDAAVAETVYKNVTVTVGGNGDADPWLGFGQGELSATIVNNLVTLKGVVSSWDGTIIDITISGTLPGGTTVALDNIEATVAPAKGIINGQLIIIKNGVQYNAQGAVIK